MSSLQCRAITNGNGILTDSVVSAPKAGDEFINLDNGEILLPKPWFQCGCHHYLKAINTIGSVSCPALVFLGWKSLSSFWANQRCWRNQGRVTLWQKSYKKCFTLLKSLGASHCWRTFWTARLKSYNVIKSTTELTDQNILKSYRVINVDCSLYFALDAVYFAQGRNIFWSFWDLVQCHLLILWIVRKCSNNKRWPAS